MLNLCLCLRKETSKERDLPDFLSSFAGLKLEHLPVGNGLCQGGSGIAAAMVTKGVT